jgi:rubrerythrin
MIRYYCRACDDAGRGGYYSGGAEDTKCPICGQQAQVVPVNAKYGRFANK